MAQVKCVRFWMKADILLGNILPMADLISCVSLEARECSIKPMDERAHNARPHPGQSLVAKRISRIMENSQILNSHADCDKQDAYSFRCIPQVHGAVLETFYKLTSTIGIEVNSATDNPLIFPNPANPGPHEVISQGNFHGEVLALCADNMSHALFELGSI